MDDGSGNTPYNDGIYIDEDFEAEIICPHCEQTFKASEEELDSNAIICPKCSNTIELDWGEEECCSGDCDCCSHEEHACNCHDNE